MCGVYVEVWGSAFSSLLVISALARGRGLHRDRDSGLYVGVGVGGGGGFVPLLVISALFRERNLSRDCVWGVEAGVREWVCSPACNLGVGSRAKAAARSQFGFKKRRKGKQCGASQSRTHQPAYTSTLTSSPNTPIHPHKDRASRIGSDRRWKHSKPPTQGP